MSEHKYTVRVEVEEGPEHPFKYQEWEWVNFDQSLIDSRDRDELLYQNAHGEVRAHCVGLQRKLDCSTAFLVSCYEHGGRSYSLRGEGTRCRFDTTDVAALLLWKGKPEDLPKDRRAELARAAVQTYEDWAEGRVYIYTVEGEDGEDSGWHGGFYGDDTDRFMIECIREDLPEDATAENTELAGNASWLFELGDIFPERQEVAA